MILEHQLWCDDIRWDLPETMILYEFYFFLCTLLSSYGYKIYFKKDQNQIYIILIFLKN